MNTKYKNLLQKTLVATCLVTSPVFAMWEDYGMDQSKVVRWTYNHGGHSVEPSEAEIIPGNVSLLRVTNPASQEKSGGFDPNKRGPNTIIYTTAQQKEQNLESLQEFISEKQPRDVSLDYVNRDPITVFETCGNAQVRSLFIKNQKLDQKEWEKVAEQSFSTLGCAHKGSLKNPLEHLNPEKFTNLTIFCFSGEMSDLKDFNLEGFSTLITLKLQARGICYKIPDLSSSSVQEMYITDGVIKDDLSILMKPEGMATKFPILRKLTIINVPNAVHSPETKAPDHLNGMDGRVLCFQGFKELNQPKKSLVYGELDDVSGAVESVSFVDIPQWMEFVKSDWNLNLFRCGFSEGAFWAQQALFKAELSDFNSANGGTTAGFLSEDVYSSRVTFTDCCLPIVNQFENLELTDDNDDEGFDC